MSDRPRALIVYDGLPRSAGGAHHLRERDPVTAWQPLSTFLAECAEVVVSERKLTLMEPSRQKLKQLRQVRAEAKRLYGRPKRLGLIFSSEDTVYENSWRLADSQLLPTLEWLRKKQPLPGVYSKPPLDVTVLAKFRLRHPVSGQVPTFQGRECYGNQDFDGWGNFLGVSCLFARLSSRSTCALILSLPFEDVSPDLKSFVAQLQEGLPFRLSRHHLSRWQLNRAGDHYYRRKVSVI